MQPYHSHSFDNYKDSFLPMTSTRFRDKGSGIGSDHFISGILVWAWAAWMLPTNIASRPPGPVNPAATGRIESKFSTARSVTIFALAFCSSAREFDTVTSDNLRL